MKTNHGEWRFMQSEDKLVKLNDCGRMYPIDNEKFEKYQAIDKLADLGETDKLWELGELYWKLNNVQRELKEMVDTDNTKTSAVVVSRRTGKTWWLLVESIMLCLKKPNAIVKFIFPQQTDAKKNIQPLISEITEDCPRHLKPVYNTQDKVFIFPNNSQIQISGANNSRIENIRGGRADLCCIDEAGFIDRLSYAIKSVLSPTIRTTGGKMILASTPSTSPDHEFITDFMVPYKATGRLKIFTIWDNPNFTDEIREEILMDFEPLREKDPDFLREYMCEIAIDKEAAICSEFYDNKASIVFSDTDEDAPQLPPHFDFYVGADIGYRDLTVMLFGYYDFRNAQLVILDELVMNGPTMTTEALAKEVNMIEEIRFRQSDIRVLPYRRVMDNDLKLINDLRQLHGIQFLPTKKDNKDGAINEMKIWMGQNRIRIHERCKHLIYHLEYGQWNNKRTDFKRLADSPDKSIQGGHVDAIPALYYLIRNIDVWRNPYPHNYGMNITEDTHIPSHFQEANKSEGAAFMAKLLNLRKKTKKRR